MIRSMTGFGRFSSDPAPHKANEASHPLRTWEIKSVNSRHLDLKWRLPHMLSCVESEFERVVKSEAHRGRVEVSLHMANGKADGQGPQFNQALAKAMIADLAQFARSQNLEYTPDLNRLAGLSMLWDEQRTELDPELVEQLALELALTLRVWNESRRIEGKALAADLNKRLIRMTEWLALIEDKTPEIKEAKCAALEERIRASLERLKLETDRDRVMQEAAVLCDRLDVTEEITRLKTHLNLLGRLLEQGGEAGKRLDFILQECFREINTLGNKAGDAQVSQLVVEFKAELEKCREQAQNIE